MRCNLESAALSLLATLTNGMNQVCMDHLPDSGGVGRKNVVQLFPWLIAVSLVLDGNCLNFNYFW